MIRKKKTNATQKRKEEGATGQTELPLERQWRLRQNK